MGGLRCLAHGDAKSIMQAQHDTQIQRARNPATTTTARRACTLTC